MAWGTKNVFELDRKVIDSGFKGLPISSHGSSIREFLDKKPHLFSSEFQYPLAILRKSALDQNLKRMSRYCADMGVVISPHVKTHMSPQIAQMQIDHGAWALTVANFSQANVFLDFGFKRIFIANEVVEPSSIREISRLNQIEGIEIFFYVDSQAGFELIKDALGESAHERIHLFIEIGAQGARAGFRDIKKIESLIELVKQDDRFDIAGVSGFEGVIPVRDRSEAGLKDVREFCQKIVEAGHLLKRMLNKSEVILTAGGSAYFDVVVEEFSKFGEGGRIVIRSGGYVAHDDGNYDRTYAFANEISANQFFSAIEVWAQVLSNPEAGLAILNLGKRDVGNDIENPFPSKLVARGSTGVKPYVAKLDRLNDQHGYLFFDESHQVNVGDIVGMGISHPCTTFDKWRYMPVVDDDYSIVDIVHTFF